jgi:NAD(P)-dependent dehydrogenase (short-subunit alcohol dehydrogenase family)
MSLDPFDMTGQTILVTGGTRGIGFAVAQALVARGASVILTGRKSETLAAATTQLMVPDRPIRGFVCHQGESTAIDNLFAQLDAEQVRLDGVVINAATNPVMGPLLQTDLAAWQKILDVNLTGAFLTAKAAVARMNQPGSIVFISSVAGIEPMAGLGAYSVSKSGLLGLMRVLASELGPNNIRVNAVAPGLVETKFAAALFQDVQSYTQILQRTPLGRHAQPEDIAGAVVFLLSRASRHVTGQTLIVDGGSRV